MPSQGLGFAWKGNSSKIVSVYIDRPSHRPLKDVSVSALEHFWTRWTLLFWTILDSSKLEQSPAAICTYVRTHLNLCLFSDLTLPPTVKFITRCTISTVDKDMVKLKFFHVNFCLASFLVSWGPRYMFCFPVSHHTDLLAWLTVTDVGNGTGTVCSTHPHSLVRHTLFNCDNPHWFSHIPIQKKTYQQK